MAKIEIPIPAMGEGIKEAIVQRFIKNVGDTVEEDEPIVEISTDKVDNELVAPFKGIVLELLANTGDTVLVGQTIVILEVNDILIKEPDDLEKSINLVKHIENASIEKSGSQSSPSKNESKSILFISKTPSGKFLSPLVRSIANKEGISIDELEQIEGSGKSNRLTKDDINEYLNNKSNNTEIEKPALSYISSATEHLFDGSTEIIEMDRIRSLISDHMINSKKTSAHVTSFIEVDVSNLVDWREKSKKKIFQTYGENITYTPIFIEAIALAIKEFPMINVSVENNKILLKKFINIGMATALPSGNLIVPVIKNAERLELLEITKKVNDLANRARQNKLKPDEIKNGTFTLSNLGLFGSLAGTPIINQPEAAILAIGSIKKRPVVIETPSGDTIGIRKMMIMSMSFDHRVIDGALGGKFLKRMAEILEGFDINRTL